MTIKQQGGIFGRNPTFNSIEANTADVSGDLSVDGNTLFVDASSNRVGVGMSPSEKFDVNGDVRVQGTSPRFKFLETDNNTKTWQWGLGGGNMLLVDDLAGTIPFRVNQGAPSNSLLVASDGDVSVSNNLVIGTSGKGIDFSATSGTGTSELFDDYEEGTWTPVPADASSGGNTGTAAQVEGIYTKIGNTVFVQFGLLNINTSGLTAGNDFYIQGLPFGAGNTSLTSYATGACIPSGSISYTGEVVAGVTDNQSAVRLVETSSGGNLDYVIVSELTSGASDIWASLVYRTA